MKIIEYYLRINNNIIMNTATSNMRSFSWTRDIFSYTT